METWASRNESDAYVVFGSNGLIGSKTKESIQSDLGNPIRLETNITHAREDTWEIARRLTEQHYDSDIKVIICAGAKGFGLTAAEKDKDLELFQALCRELSACKAVKWAVLTSSLGCALSSIDSSYKQLMRAKEELFSRALSNRAAIGRISSVYGSNKGKYSGLAGILLYNTVNSRPTDIYASLSTRRNYLEAEGCGGALRALAGAGRVSDASNLIYNICAERSMSASEIVSCAYRVTKRKPIVRLQEYTPLASEDHFADPHDNVNSILVNRSLAGWMSRELGQLKRFHGFP